MQMIDLAKEGKGALPMSGSRWVKTRYHVIRDISEAGTKYAKSFSYFLWKHLLFALYMCSKVDTRYLCKVIDPCFPFRFRIYAVWLSGKLTANLAKSGSEAAWSSAFYARQG
ncbi:ATP-dependent DNA helicase MPH1 [Fusarium oxysporum f. sp. albedinis]|nr:ATP-dependent DNA helicase MPH1 [Fusarium oxysporum f. sp. albedinis]